MQLFAIVIAAAAVSVGTIHVAIKMNQLAFDRFVMGIIRDIGRHKARQRRFSNSKGLIQTLLHQDNPLEDLLLGVDEDDELNIPTYTRTELYEFGNGLDGKPILISLFGRVYDVTAGKKFYGPGGPYANFGGHDVTYSLSTACRTDECLFMSVEDLDEKLLKEGKRWLSFFHLHDKYPLVGKLDTDYMEILMSELVDESIKDAKGGKPLIPIFQTAE
jgi:membrane-associated progesterone receptor component